MEEPCDLVLHLQQPRRLYTHSVPGTSWKPHHGLVAHSFLGWMHPVHLSLLSALCFSLSAEMFLRLLNRKLITHFAWIIPLEVTQFTFLASSSLFRVSSTTLSSVIKPFGSVTICHLTEGIFAVKMNVMGLNLNSASCYLQVLKKIPRLLDLSFPAYKELKLLKKTKYSRCIIHCNAHSRSSINVNYFLNIFLLVSHLHVTQKGPENVSRSDEGFA